MSSYIVSTIIALILLYGFFKGTDMFSAFLKGATGGLKVVCTILPSIIAMLTAVNMLRASGALDMLISLCAPIASAAGIPPDCVPLMLLKPVSGGGALAIGSDIMAAAGVDTLAGRTAAVMLASADTTFFVLSVYFGSLKIKNIRHSLPAALTADFAAFLGAAWAVRFLL